MRGRAADRARRMCRFPPGHACGGFTLVEILIVCAIVGILSAMAIGSAVMARANTRMSIVNNDLRIIADAVDTMAFETGLWPGAIEAGKPGNPEIWDLNTDVAGLRSDRKSRFPKWKGPYMQTIPRDPWGSNYFFDPDYTVGSNKIAVIGSFGPNRRGRNTYDSDDIYMVLR